MTYREDAGHVGEIESLAGVKGTLIETSGQAPSVTSEVVLLPVNPRRYWALIQNSSTTETISVQLGTQGGFYVELLPKGIIQIDKNLPWTGAITAVSQGAAATVRAVEASVIS